ncbi:MAG: type II toxin-antitoxin system RelE/ParE family toxin [Chryseotalea sp.]
MVEKIIWSLKAQEDRKQILNYWINRNKSTNYSIKLDHKFRDALNLIKDHPQIGKSTNLKNVRIKIVTDYLMVYEIKENTILLLAIWDSRQDPRKLKKIVR